MEKIKVFLADDHQLFLDGLMSLLAQIPEIEIVATANNGAQLLEKLKTQKGDLVILDLHMPDLDGLETTKKLKKDHPELKILGLTMEDDLEAIRNMLDAGASGYVLKNTGKAELEMAIQQIMKGGTYLSQAVGNQLAKSFLLNKKPAQQEKNELDMLTEREVEILVMIAQENSNAEIADKLFISPKTVETHRKNLMKKIGVSNSLGVYKFALHHKLIE